MQLTLFGTASVQKGKLKGINHKLCDDYAVTVPHYKMINGNFERIVQKLVYIL